MTVDRLLVLAVIVSLNVFPSLQLTTLSLPVITLRPILAHHGEDDLLPCLCEPGEILNQLDMGSSDQV